MLQKINNLSEVKHDQNDVLVIGGGIIGLCTAYYLLRTGRKVTVLDEGDFSDNCSYGNAGMIVPSHFTPLAAPGMVTQGLRWMFSKSSPFSIRPTADPKVLSWLWQFAKHANARHVARVAPSLKSLHLYSSELYGALSKDLEMEVGLKRRGILMLFKEERTRLEEIELAHRAQDLGLDVSVLDTEAVQQLEPEVKLDVLGAAHYRCDSHLDPSALMRALLASINRMGGTLVPQAKVDGFVQERQQLKAAVVGEQSFAATQFVITGGARLGTLASKLGLRVPILAGKGYSWMSSVFEGKLQHPALLLEARVAVTPMSGQVRIGGTMELAAMHKQVNMPRVGGIADAIAKYFPDHVVARPKETEVWIGFRPCSPDGLPYLGASKRYSNLYIGGGMGMMGLSLGPASGSVLANLLNDTSPPDYVNYFDPARFQ